MKHLLRKKWLAVGVAALAATAVGTLALAAPLAGVINQRSATQSDPGTGPGVGVPGKLVFQGSTTVGPIIAASVGSYNTYRGATVIEGSLEPYIIQNGSGQGREAASRHWTDIANASSISTSETWLNTIPVARDGLVFITNQTGAEWSGHHILNMTKTQIDDIYEGRARNWNQITDPVTATVGPNLAITARARIIGSGTRAAWKDVTGGTFVTPLDEDPAYDPAFSWPTGGTTENRVIVQTGLQRFVHNVDTLAAVNNPTASGQCAYTGLGQDEGVNITKINIGKTTAGPFWAPTGINIYSGSGGVPSYPFGRFLYVVTPKYVETTGDLSIAPTGTTPYTAPNQSDINNYIAWLRATDGTSAPSGQKAVTDAGFLKLVPDEDVNGDNAISVNDLVLCGNAFGQTGTPRWIRSDVNGDGGVTVNDLVRIGNWFGVVIVPS